MTASHLEAKAIKVSFGNLTALDDVTFDLRVGELLGLIGANGSGKSTLVNVLSGYQPIDSGGVRIDGNSITGYQPEKLCSLGLVRTFQSARNFGKLTVKDNIKAAATTARRLGRSSPVFELDNLTEFWGLSKYSNHFAEDLPHGAARNLAIARALATQPRFLLLDEPAAGLNEHESLDLRNKLTQLIQTAEMAILIIEHDMQLILQLCTRIIVLDYGRKIAEGTASEIMQNEAVQNAYLGSNSREPDVKH